MPSFLENFLLAQTIAKRINARVTSSNDIISIFDRPVHMNDERLQELESYYGKETIESYQRYNTTTQFLQSKIQDVYDKHSTKIIAPITTYIIAVGLLGLGECHALAGQVQLELLRAGRNDHSIVRLQNGLSPYHIGNDHVIVFLGSGFNSEPLSIGRPFTPQRLQNLPEECIAIDLLLHYVGPARALLKHQADFYNRYRLNYIADSMSFNNVTPEIAQKIERNAIKIAHETGITPRTKQQFTLCNTTRHLFHLPTSAINASVKDTVKKEQEPMRVGAPQLSFFKHVERFEPIAEATELSLSLLS